MVQEKHTKNPVIILAIDTSCDDTSAAVTQGRVVLSNIISSQNNIHQEYGGVVPSLAKRAHQERIDAVISKALRVAHVHPKDIFAIAVTYGPGLAIALEVGITSAKKLAKEWNKPLIAVNHMEGHIYSVFALPKTDKDIQSRFDESIFPSLVLLVSGGHTELLIMKAHGVYSLLGETLDDAVGEAFDKTARMLGLGYPGGRILAEFAKKGNAQAYSFPIPLRERKDYHFSYSGLKTAVFRCIQEITHDGKHTLSQKEIQDISASFQYAAIRHLIDRTQYALVNHPVRSIILGGGVSANLLLRAQLRIQSVKHSVAFFYPKQRKLSMDNGAMIGVAASYKIERNEFAAMNDLDRDPTLPL